MILLRATTEIASPGSCAIPLSWQLACLVACQQSVMAPHARTSFLDNSKAGPSGDASEPLLSNTDQPSAPALQQYASAPPGANASGSSSPVQQDAKPEGTAYSLPSNYQPHYASEDMLKIERHHSEHINRVSHHHGVSPCRCSTRRNRAYQPRPGHPCPAAAARGYPARLRFVTVSQLGPRPHHCAVPLLQKRDADPRGPCEPVMPAALSLLSTTSNTASCL